MHAFVLVVAATGMRRGEAAALRWGDLDLEAGAVRVDEAVVAVDGGVGRHPGSATRRRVPSFAPASRTEAIGST